MTLASQTTPSLRSLVVSTVRAAPLHFLLLQIPETSIDFVDKWLEPLVQENHWILLVTVVPYFVVCSALSTSLTFVSVVEVCQGKRPTLATTLRAVLARLVPLLASAFLAAALVIVGLPLFFIPALYFLTIYLFVPYYVMAEPTGSPSIYLALSKRLAKANLGKTFGVTFILLAVGLGLYYAGDGLDAWAGADVARKAVATGINVFLSLVSSCMMNVGVSHYFLKLRAP